MWWGLGAAAAATTWWLPSLAARPLTHLCGACGRGLVRSDALGERGLRGRRVLGAGRFRGAGLGDRSSLGGSRSALRGRGRLCGSNHLEDHTFFGLVAVPDSRRSR